MHVLVLKNSFKLLTDIAIVPVVLAVGISFVWQDFLLAAVIAAAFFMLIRWLSDKQFSVRTPGDWGIFLMLTMIPITLWVTTTPAKTVTQVLRLLSGIALYYAIVNWCNTPNRLRMIIPGYIFLGTSLALIAPISVRWATNKLPVIPTTLYKAIPSLFADTVHPNVLAGSLAILFPIAFAMLLFAYGDLTWFERVTSGLALLVMTVILGLTVSRGAWLALGAVLIVAPALRWRWGWIGAILIAILGGITIKLIGVAPLVQFLASSGTITGLDGRLEIMSNAIYMIQDFPFTGIGLGAFKEVADALYPLFLYDPGSIEHAHNLFLQIAVDLGIPGFIGWLIVLVSIIVVSWNLIEFGKREKNNLAAGLGAGLLCSQLALVIHGMTDAVTWGMVKPAPIVWAIWGLAVSSWIVIVKEAEPRIMLTE